MRRLIPLLFILLSVIICSCGEWVSGDFSSYTCYLDYDLQIGHSPIRAFTRNNGNELFILDNQSTISRYRKSGISECNWDLDYSWESGGRLWINGFPKDISGSYNDVFWSDGSRIYSEYGKECYTGSGTFAIDYNGGTAITGNSNGGTQIYRLNSNNCSRERTLSSMNTLAVAQDNYGYYAVEASGKVPQNLVLYSNSGAVSWVEPLSINYGNEKYFCSVTRLVSTNTGLYLLDSECKKLGVFYNDGSWRTIDLNSYGAPLDIMAAENYYIYVLTKNKVIKINARY